MGYGGALKKYQLVKDFHLNIKNFSKESISMLEPEVMHEFKPIGLSCPQFTLSISIFQNKIHLEKENAEGELVFKDGPA